MSKRERIDPAAALKRRIAGKPAEVERIATITRRTTASVYGWAAGSSRPAPDVRARLQAATGIPAWHWLTEDERVGFSNDA